MKGAVSSMADCACSGDNVLIFACSGGSNVGQISNEAAKRLDQEGIGRMYCLAGVGGAVEAMIANAQGADCVIAIDGCPVGCAKAVLDNAGVPVSSYTIVTDLGIEKEHRFEAKPDAIEVTCQAARAGMPEPRDIQSH